ncbi:ribonuclease P [Candidatus Woesearchaeota archaeon]|nr:ribonuclease P [Candidatus Woesearchaeota archaeon]
MAKQAFKRIARKRIHELFELAAEVFSIDPALSTRYVSLARKIAMRFKVRIPRALKRKFCKHCYAYLVPGKNARVRVQNGKVVIFCTGCKKYTRIPLSK